MSRYTVALAALLITAAAAMAVEPVNTKGFSSAAIKGYDPVAYFTESKAVKGSKNQQLEWQGATWRFSSKKNRDLFNTNPQKYVPQYGGYCAYAMAEGKAVGVDPTQFTILNGKLYLNYNAKVNAKWSNDREAYIKRADAQWPVVLKR